MKNRLPACDRRHAGVESDIVIYYSESKGGEIRRCKVCMRIRAQLMPRRRVKAPVETREAAPRLTWPAPEFLLRQ